MKLLALLTLLPAVFALPSPEAYNPFLAPPIDLSSSSGNNPISHGALNSRNLLSAAAGQQAHLSNKRAIKSVRRVKRATSGSCVPRDVSSSSKAVASSTAATSTSTSSGKGTVTASPTKVATTTQGQATVRPTTSPVKSSTTSLVKSSSTSPAKSSTTTSRTSTAATPAKTNFTVDPDGNGPFKGQATYYDTDVGYGSCGTWHKNWQPTVALSRELMDNWPGYNGLNPNNNPICGQRLQLNYQGKTLIAEVQDTCPSCTKRWIDVSQGIFEYFAATSVGMLGIDGYTPGFTWQWVDRNTPLTVLPH